MTFHLNVKSKYWCITVNNYSEDDLYKTQELWISGMATYLLMGFEVGESGTPHVQGYIELGTRIRGVTLLDFLPQGTHLESRAGSAQQAADYCKKDENADIYEEGVLSKSRQGKRTDLLKIQEEIDNGATPIDIADQFFSKWVVYNRSFDKYHGMLIPDRDWITKVFVLQGPTGTGKSRIAHSMCHGKLYKLVDKTFMWFDGYRGQSHCIIDDFNGQGSTVDTFLEITDRYAVRVPVKGGFINFSPKVIYITTNLSVEQWYPDISALQVDAIKRRITRIINLPTLPQFDANNRPIGSVFNILE